MNHSRSESASRWRACPGTFAPNWTRSGSSADHPVCRTGRNRQKVLFLHQTRVNSTRLLSIIKCLRVVHSVTYVTHGPKQTERVATRVPPPPGAGWREFGRRPGSSRNSERIGVDEIAVGREALATEERMAVPPDSELADWRERARETGVRSDIPRADRRRPHGCRRGSQSG